VNYTGAHIGAEYCSDWHAGPSLEFEGSQI